MNSQEIQKPELFAELNSEEAASVNGGYYGCYYGGYGYRRYRRAYYGYGYYRPYRRYYRTSYYYPSSYGYYGTGYGYGGYGYGGDCW